MPYAKAGLRGRVLNSQEFAEPLFDENGERCGDETQREAGEPERVDADIGDGGLERGRGNGRLRRIQHVRLERIARRLRCNLLEDTKRFVC